MLLLQIMRVKADNNNSLSLPAADPFCVHEKDRVRRRWTTNSLGQLMELIDDF
jgi:hypothetical protein